MVVRLRPDAPRLSLAPSVSLFSASTEPGRSAPGAWPALELEPSGVSLGCGGWFDATTILGTCAAPLAWLSEPLAGRPSSWSSLTSSSSTCGQRCSR